MPLSSGAPTIKKGVTEMAVKTMNKSKEYLERDGKFVNQVLSRYSPTVIERGQGTYLYNMEGEKFLDFGCGIAVTNIGHCHPKVVEAIQKQAEKLLHVSVTAYHPNYIDLAEKLVEITPKSLDSVFLTNSGAEAVEGAVKMARYVTGRPAIINFRGSFHGRTYLCASLTTSKLYYRDMGEPLAPSIHTAPFPYEYQMGKTGEEALQETFEYIDMLFHQFVNPNQVAAFLVEPVLGEGGYVVPPKGFLSRLKKLAQEHGILLIADEVQTGFGRSGKMFAVEHDGVEPDIMTMAKGIAAGMPLAAFISRKELTSKWPSARHGTTYGGNPVSCAAALANIKVIQEEKLVERAAETGARMLARLQKFAQGKKHIAEVRGQGMLIGIEFKDEHGKPSKDWAEKVAQRCLEDKMIVLTCGQQGQVVRLIPPLNISPAEEEEAMTILEKALS